MKIKFVQPPRLMKKAKKILNIFYWVLFITVLLVGSMTILSMYGGYGNLKLYVVQSGSMEPVIRTGSVVINFSESNYMKGDIITFKGSNNSITHRIVDIEEDAEKLFITKGDANNSVDSEKVSSDQILGKVRYSIPKIGFLINFVKTQVGFMLLIIFPTSLIIVSELLTIKEEAKKILARRYKKLTPIQKVEVAVGTEEIIIEKGFRQLFRRFKNK